MNIKTIERSKLCLSISEDEIEKINTRFRELAKNLNEIERRRPLVIEFAGIPKAGKTGVRNAIVHLALKAGFRVYYPAEGASLPEQRNLRENLISFNTWTGMYALQNILSSCYPVNQYDLVILDRGICDAICWMEMLSRQNYVRKEATEAVQAFLSLPEWMRLVDMVVIFECDQKTAQTRENSGAIVKSRLERTGPLIAALRDVFRDGNLFQHLHTRGGRFIFIDTSDSDESKTNKKAVAFSIAEEIESMFMDAVDPDLVVIPSSLVDFSGYVAKSKTNIEAWMPSLLIKKASFAESSSTLKQVVSYGFIELDGQIFRLHRTGSANREELRSKLSIGVGGHMEEKDLDGQASLEAALKECLIRELSEELLMDEKPEVELLGFIYDETIPAGSHHLAAFHRVKLHRGNVRVRQEVSDQEFGDGSWALVPPDKIFAEADKFDPWSQIIIHEVLGGPKPSKMWQTFFPLTQ